MCRGSDPPWITTRGKGNHMRRSRTLRAALALTVFAAPVAMTGSAYADEPIAAVGGRDIALPDLQTRCDLSAYASPGVALDVGMVTRDLTTARYNPAGGAIPHTNVDDTWTVPAKSPDDAYSIQKHPNWIAPAANSNWINSRPDFNSTGTGGVSVEDDLAIGELLATDGAVPAVKIATPLPVLPTRTTFRATFDVYEQSYANRLDLWYAADNGVTFYLNGTPIGGFDPAGADPTAFQQERPLAYAGPLIQDGTNVLDAVVTDYGVATGLLVRGGYSGCVVRYAVEGTCLDIQENAVYATAPQRIDLNTGSQGGSRDAYGTVDSKWRSVRFWTAPDAYSVAPYNGWFNNLTTANWIHEQPSAGTGSLGMTYAYEITFPVGVNLNTAEIDVDFAADDTARFYLNNTLIGAGGNWGALTPFNWAGAFNPGTTNRLRVEVVDSGLVASGLLVQGEARVCYNRAISHS